MRGLLFTEVEFSVELDDSAPALSTQRQDKIQHRRLTITLLSVANIALQSVIVALYAWIGEVPWWVAPLYFAVFGGSTAGYVGTGAVRAAALEASA